MAPGYLVEGCRLTDGLDYNKEAAWAKWSEISQGPTSQETFERWLETVLVGSEIRAVGEVR